MEDMKELSEINELGINDTWSLPDDVIYKIFGLSVDMSETVITSVS